MKRLIPTLVLVVLCIGGFWYASSKDFFKEKKPEAAALVTVKKEDVAGYTIKKDDSVIEMQQKDGKWTMTKPSPLPLNSYSPAGWVDSFNGATKEKTVDANPSDLKQFGLDQPKQEFTIRLTNGTTYTLSVGDPVKVQGFFYAKLSGSPEVFQIAEAKVTSLAKQPMDFMEKSPVVLNYEQLRAVTVDWKGQPWTLTKTDTDKRSYEANWKLRDKELKGGEASQIIDNLIFMATEQPLKPAAEVKGLDTPELKIEVKEVDTSNKETVSAYSGKIEGNVVWIAKKGGEWAYSIPVDRVQELYDKAKEQPPAQK